MILFLEFFLKNPTDLGLMFPLPFWGESIYKSLIASIMTSFHPLHPVLNAENCNSLGMSWRMPGRTGGSLNWSLIFSLLIGIFRWRVGVGVEGGGEGGGGQGNSKLVF